MDVEEADNPSAGEALPIQVTAQLSQFIENMGLHYENYGVPRIGGRILGLLLVAARPISSEEMSDALQVSRSSISTNLKTLLMSAMVDKVSLPGERVDYYVFSDKGWTQTLQMRLAGILELKSLGEAGLCGLEPGHPSRQRIEEMICWVDMVQKMLEKLNEEWQESKTVPLSPVSE